MFAVLWQHTSTHTSGHLKKKWSELWKENLALLKPRFRRQIDALLPHFHSQTPTDTISLAPKVWSPPPPPPSLPYVSKGTLKTVTPGSLATFWASLPSAEAIHRLCKRLEHSKIWKFFIFLLFSLFFSRDYFYEFVFSWRVAPELLYIFLTRLMHSANSFLIF